MNLKTVVENGNWHSEKLSEVNRQLAYAGIAVIWIFKSGDGGAQNIPKDLYAPLCYFGLGLLVDLAHYLSSTVIWKCLLFRKERTIQKEEIETHLFRIPKAINYTSYCLLYFKVSFVAIGYGLVINWCAKNWGLW